MNNIPKPYFSVVIPVFNNADFLNETIDSVIAQTFENWELLIIDDGSSDDSYSISESYSNKYGNITLLTHPQRENRGVSATRNLGIKYSQGEWIAFLDADDLWYKNRLESHFNVIQTHIESQLAFVYSTAKIIDEKGNFIDEKSDVKQFNIKYGIHGSGRPGLISDGFKWVVDKGFEASTPSVSVKAEIIKKLDGFNEDLTYSEDAIMWYRIIEDHDFYFINEPLLNIRVHTGSWNAGASNELKISRRFNAYSYMIDIVSVENRKYICWLHVNKGFRIIARSYCGYPYFNMKLVISNLKGILTNNSVGLKLKLYAFYVLAFEVLITPFRAIKNTILI